MEQGAQQLCSIWEKSTWNSFFYYIRHCCFFNKKCHNTADINEYKYIYIYGFVWPRNIFQCKKSNRTFWAFLAPNGPYHDFFPSFLLLFNHFSVDTNEVWGDYQSPKKIYFIPFRYKWHYVTYKYKYNQSMQQTSVFEWKLATQMIYL